MELDWPEILDTDWFAALLDCRSGDVSSSVISVSVTSSTSVSSCS